MDAKQDMKTQVKLINDESSWQEARKIRIKVFVEEQKVPEVDEIDEFEGTSRHFIAVVGQTPAGTARWRATDNGVKLERFAVLEGFRGKGTGSALVQAVLDDIMQDPKSHGKKCYLHAQVSAVGLYEKFGFEAKGSPFDECGIMHYYMERYL